MDIKTTTYVVIIKSVLLVKIILLNVFTFYIQVKSQVFFMLHVILYKFIIMTSYVINGLFDKN